jgi:hypothetical protein
LIDGSERIRSNVETDSDRRVMDGSFRNEQPPKEKEFFGLKLDEWKIVAQTAATAAGSAMTAIKATKKRK